jgi:hypothetical protein
VMVGEELVYIFCILGVCGFRMRRIVLGLWVGKKREGEVRGFCFWDGVFGERRIMA